jgi:hypothetical protein
MPSVEGSPVEGEVGHDAPRNLPASASLGLGVAGPFLFLMFMGLRGLTFRWTLFYAVSLAGLLAIAYGIVGLVIARRQGVGRAWSWVGISLGTCSLVMTAIVGLVVWEISRLPSNGF